MNRSNNAQTKNLPKSGNILDGFKALNDIIPNNDGTRSFIQLASDAYDISLPLSGETSETTIKLTHKDHMISQINDSFLQVTQNITIRYHKLQHIILYLLMLQTHHIYSLDIREVIKYLDS